MKTDTSILMAYRPLVILLSQGTTKGRKRLHAAIDLRSGTSSSVVFEVSVGDGEPKRYNNLTEAINAYEEI